MMKMNRKIAGLAVCLLLLSSLLIGCPGEQAKPPEVERGEGEKVVVPQELNIALGMGIGGLDPHGSLSGDARIVWANIYETLAYLDEKMGIQPRLATDWEVSKDAKVWTFKLREGVKFHDGTPFNAEAVKFTFERHTRDKPFAVGVEIENIEIVNDYKVRFHLKEPFVPLLSELTRTRSSIISPTAVVAGEEFEPIGTGPFVFEEWVKEEKIVLSRNNDYWGGAQPLSRVTFKIIPDAHTRVMAFEAGEVDIVGIGRGHIPPEEIQRLKDNPQVQLKSRVLSHNTVWLAMNQRNEFLQDLKVRKAVNYAVDVESIVEHVIEGAGEIAVAPWSPAKVFGVRPGLQLPGYDPEKSKTLLAESGWADADGDGVLDKDGSAFKITLTVQNIPPWRATAEAVQAQLLDVGIDMEIVELERGAFSKLLRKQDFDIIGISGRGLPSNDPYMHISNFYHSRYGFRVGEEGPNPSLINNPRLDVLIGKTVGTVDPEERKDIYHKIQEIIVGEAVGVYLYHSSLFTALQENVKGFEISGGFWNLCLRGVHSPGEAIPVNEYPELEPLVKLIGEENLSVLNLVGFKAAEKAMEDLPFGRGDSNVLALSNAGSPVIESGAGFPATYYTVEGAIDGVLATSGCTLGRGNLILVNQSIYDSLWFAFFDKQTGECVYLEVDHDILKTYLDDESAGTVDYAAFMNLPADTLFSRISRVNIKPDALIETANAEAWHHNFADKVFGGNEFRILTISAVWDKGMSYVFVRAVKLHNHVCPGLTSGYFMAKYLDENFPLGKDECYVVWAVPPWCKDDAFKTIFDATVGKRRMAVMYIPKDVREQIHPEYQTIAGIFVKFNKATGEAQAIVLGWDWEQALADCGVSRADLKDRATHKWWWARLRSSVLLVDREPEEYVSTLKVVDLGNQGSIKKMMAKWMAVGSNPLVELGIMPAP